MIKRFRKSKLGKLLIGGYVIYVAVLMIGSLQLGIQLGTELRSVPEDQRMEYISQFLEKKL